MARWKPDARARLEKAAMHLYYEHGFTQTTVAEIAERAGLTERTFFRYFADKREVLFSGAPELQRHIAGALESAPPALSPIDAVGAAIDSTAPIFEQRREFARRRQAIIAENAELQERERVKLASLASTLADGLRRRGVREPAASLAAEMGVLVFRLAFERWTGQTTGGSLAKIMRETRNQLKSVSAGASQTQAGDC